MIHTHKYHEDFLFDSSLTNENIAFCYLKVWLVVD